MSKFEENLSMNGHLKITEIRNGTSEVVFDDQNVITDEGFSEIFKRITLETGDPSADESYFFNIVLGDDIGSGTLLNPEPSDASLTSADQDVVLEIDNADINFTYPTANQAALDVTLLGSTVMAENFPSESAVAYTSATIRFKNGKTFSFKRFPARTISGDVTILITWIITFNRT